MNVFKRVALIAALCLLFRGAVALGADSALDSLLQVAMGDGGLVESTVLSQSPLLTATAETTEPEQDTAEAEAAEEADEEESDEDGEHLPIYMADEPLADGETETVSINEITITGDDTALSAEGVYVKNSTDYEVDVEELLNEPLSFDPSGDGDPVVLILHTHGSEAYEPEGDDWYDNSDNYRSEDEEVNVIRVGDEIAAVFEERGITVLHDRNLYDYPSYIGSYPRSLSAAEWYLSQYPGIQIIIDVHRDAILDTDGSYMKTVAEVDGEDSAQVMLVVGTDSTGLDHPEWRENLKFALRLQATMTEKYPSLARPLSLREERFNQHLTPGTILLEVGSNGNTLQEAITAGKLFAECAADVITSGSTA